MDGVVPDKIDAQRERMADIRALSEAILPVDDTLASPGKRFVSRESLNDPRIVVRSAEEEHLALGVSDLHTSVHPPAGPHRVARCVSEDQLPVQLSKECRFHG